MKKLMFIALSIASIGIAAAQGPVSTPSVTFPAPTVTDSSPIIQASQIANGYSSFTGQYYSDPVLAVGYNVCTGPGGITAPCNTTDPLSIDLQMEADYEFNGGVANSTGTATTGTSTTVLDDSGKIWTTNQWKDWVLYDSTRSASAVISSNTATSITVAPSITGMASGDSYQVLQRHMEARWGYEYNGNRYPAFQFNVDRATVQATNSGHLVGLTIAVPTCCSYGAEFISDMSAGTDGSGNGDIVTISSLNGAGSQLTMYRVGGSDPLLQLQGIEPQMQWYAQGSIGENWVSGAASRGDMIFGTYSTGGTGYRALEWDPNGPTYLFGDTSGVFTSYVFQGGGPVKAGALISNGTTFTISSGCAAVSSLKGGRTAGSFSTTATICTPVISLPAAPHGWSCNAKDITHPVVFTQTATSTTSCTVSGATTSGDTIVFDAVGF